MIDSTDNSRPFLSIVLPTYNRAALLKRFLETAEESLNNARRRTPVSVEIIISDNCSSDETWDYLQAYNDQLPYRVYINRNNSNIGGTKNIVQAVERTNGRWIIICGDDDEMAPDSIEIIANTAEQNPDRKLLSFWTSSRPTEEWVDSDLHISLNTLAEKYYYYPGNCGMAVVDGDSAREAVGRMRKAGVAFSCWPITEIVACASSMSDVDEPILLSPKVIARHPNHGSNTSYSSYYLLDITYIGLVKSALNVDRTCKTQIAEVVAENTLSGKSGREKLRTLFFVHLLNDLPQDVEQSLEAARIGVSQLPGSAAAFCRRVAFLMATPMWIKKTLYLTLLAAKHPGNFISRYSERMKQRERNLRERAELLQKKDATGVYTKESQF